MNLFIDTNILLNFFHFSKDSLEELEKVFVLQSYGKINLWLTDQVELEFQRNRETKIADALRKFLDEKPNSGIPHVARGYPECDQLMEALKQVNSSREMLMEKVRKDISETTGCPGTDSAELQETPLNGRTPHGRGHRGSLPRGADEQPGCAGQRRIMFA